MSKTKMHSLKYVCRIFEVFRLWSQSKNIEKNIFAGLKCSDCGANLNYKFTHDNPDNHYFSCRNQHAQNGLCKKTHHIRVDVLTHLVKNDISNIVQFATEFEDEFVKIVVDENYKRIQATQKSSKCWLATKNLIHSAKKSSKRKP